MTEVILGANQYGKAECRLVRVRREDRADGSGGATRHVVTDLNVTSQLRGDFVACHTEGDNGLVVATDTQKNTVYAFAREHGVDTPERFLLLLADHFTGGFEQVTGGRWHAESYAWDRLPDAAGAPHDHAFARAGREMRHALVEREGSETHVLAGFTDAVVMKTTGSEFHGFPRDRYTTLAETTDRVMATSVTAWWRYTDTGLDHDALYTGIRDLMLETFADVHSLALQQTIFAMGRAVLERYEVVGEVRLSCPNKHHFLVDLEPFGLDNPGEVFLAADRPYGLIEATVQRRGASVPERVWASVAGFC